MSVAAPVRGITGEDVFKRWVADLERLFSDIEAKVASRGWTAVRSAADLEEEPFGIGAPISYQAPVLVLQRADENGSLAKVTFEPRHRNTIGAAGRVEVYSYPKYREAMLLRIPAATNVAELTWEQVENLVSQAPWKAFSSERLPLQVDMYNPDSLCEFLEDLTA